MHDQLRNRDPRTFVVSLKQYRQGTGASLLSHSGELGARTCWLFDSSVREAQDCGGDLMGIVSNESDKDAALWQELDTTGSRRELRPIHIMPLSLGDFSLNIGTTWNRLRWCSAICRI